MIYPNKLCMDGLVTSAMQLTRAFYTARYSSVSG